MAENNFEKFFPNADDETKSRLSKLEKSLKQASLIVDLGNHDGVKLIREFCSDQVSHYEELLKNQSAADLSKQEELMRRAVYEALRGSFKWFVDLFEMNEAKKERLEEKVEIIKNGEKENE